jgi:hypothetical protein
MAMRPFKHGVYMLNTFMFDRSLIANFGHVRLEDQHCDDGSADSPVKIRLNPFSKKERSIIVSRRDIENTLKNLFENK